MTAADYAHDERCGNSQGLHYSTFEPPSKKRAHARSTSCSKKIFPRCANPPSWVSIANPLSPTRCQDRFLAGLATLVVSAGAKILGRAHASGIASPQFPHQVGTTRSIPQTPQPFLFEAPLPFVAGLATDPQPPSQPRHALLGLKSQLHKLQPSRR